MTSLTMEVAKAAGVKPRDAERSKNFFALGLVSWLYSRPIDGTLDWIEKRFATTPMVLDANTRAFKAGYNFGETAELFESTYQVRPAALEPGVYTNITGNTALAWGLIAAAHQAQLPLFLGSYPITPASDILHELSKHKHFGVRTVQAEDEIAGVGAAIGAAFGGSLGRHHHQRARGRPQVRDRSAWPSSLELPLLVIDIQRGGPSTGLPTKTEQSDLLHAMYGRHGEAPVPIVAPMTPVALLRGGHRGGPHRRQVPHPGDPALRRVPGQRGRAVAAARPRRPCPTSHVEFATETNHTEEDGTPRPSGPISATRDHPGPTVGRARHARASSTASGPREGRRLGQRLLRPGQPRADGPSAGRQGGRHRQRHPPARGRRPRRHRRRPGARPRLGLDLRRHRGRRSAGCGPGARRWPMPISST